MFGAATGRAEAHTIRLALIYALLDSSAQIARPHLDAALALWRYTRDSTHWVFGDSLGDPTADDIWALAKERAHGISRTEVRDLFSRNKKPARSTAPSPHSSTPAASNAPTATTAPPAAPPRSGSRANRPPDRDFGRFGRTSPARSNQQASPPRH